MNKQKTSVVIAITILVVISFSVLIGFLFYKLGYSRGALETAINFARNLSPQCLSQFKSR